jgi:hypothetical protein
MTIKLCIWLLKYLVKNYNFYKILDIFKKVYINLTFYKKCLILSPCGRTLSKMTICIDSHFLNKKLAKVISTPASRSLKKLHTAEKNTRPQSIQGYKLQ